MGENKAEYEYESGTRLLAGESLSKKVAFERELNDVTERASRVSVENTSWSEEHPGQGEHGSQREHLGWREHQ